MEAVFIDRDGVINENLNGDYVKEWKEFKFLPGVLHSLKLLKTNKVKVVVVSNQSGVAKGLMTEKQLSNVSRYFVKKVKDCGGNIEAIYYCVHNVGENCDCRKPKPGLLLKASKELGIDLNKTYIVGDYISDIEAGVTAGSKTILVRTGRGKETISKRDEWTVEPDYIVSDLSEAVEIIIKSKLKS
ncbi:MAG: hypothetical protein A3C43_10820 [Candidatus Schekmanbacteria bacterium RIFCSPHIGHO2_02_FULL_38_11]|uniref:D,D-heptose 1,7-bisphosphate phosphatase n=1 Tax=Candidatus Schekmanbacteria bacterium RIFCSPLOWO2_12_FULL_38_15 TaxID=1817883 RepID=A0A1F7SIE1_9BACT|nr:MAG: hypothetical protein A2043_00185 [Candidatus Schekmanbacteria bacterium GWA2_38_9]OGL49631.1 MAG: hypothetical protein A3H37_01150 [Candidatus Schekmanbacteria bacterium RIFCSPLOWO2_02_FULL_38_14]OGL50353.1 MAG: hypothetical protein A3C43_10820 [Candidatus Schekmanbacteria bacterium RIFCSPHIGHO2_02_FULL_38_11]OGL52984.1 MAG: hypothetical protein A3G31_08705 [Candidatus Schekmanbacteria bacterium RIFCSPLOWO2_12_FULL_38_15]